MRDLIDRQAAIDVCNNAIDLWHGQLGEGIVIAVRKKIAELPSAQPNLQPTCNQLATDCISRQAAIKAIEDLQDCYNGFSDTYDKACIIGALEEVPSAQPEITEEQVKEYCESRNLVVLTSEAYQWLKSLKSKAEEFRWNGGGNY